MTRKYAPVPTSDVVPTDRLSAGQLLDIVRRCASVLEENEHADEHAPLIAQLRGIAALVSDIIDGSHRGCAADEDVLYDPLHEACPDDWNEVMK